MAYGFSIKAENVKLWVNEHTKKDGSKFKTYAVSVSRKNEDGETTYKSVKLFISRKVDIPANIQSGTEVSFSGFPTIDSYTNKDGKEVSEIAFMATQMDFGNTGNNAAPAEPEAMPEGYAEIDDDFPF